MSTGTSPRLVIISALVIAILGFDAVALAAIVSGTSTTNVSAHVTYTQLTINKPTGSVGDVMVASIAVNDGTIANVSAPSGWTLIARTDNDVNVSLLSYWKVLSNSEPSSYTWTIDEQTKAVGGITSYSGVDISSPVDVSAGNSGYGNIATTSPLTTSAPNAEVIAIYATDVNKSFSTPAGMTQKYNLSHTTAGPTTAAFDVIQTVAGTVSSASSTISGNKARNWASQQIALRPALTVTTSPLTVSSSTLALWSMNGTPNSAAKKADEGPYVLNLNEVGSPAASTGQTYPTSNGAYLLDGSTQYATSTDTGLPAGNASYTVETWIKLPASAFSGCCGDDYNIIAWGTRSDYEMAQIAVLGTSAGLQGHISWGSYGENHQTSGVISPDIWHYVAVTYNGTQICFYLNGELDSCTSVTNTPSIVLSGTNYIGVNNDATTQFFPGSIDQVRVSSVARSSTEIYNYYHGI